jgi:hypothetical protein
MMQDHWDAMRRQNTDTTRARTFETIDSMAEGTSDVWITYGVRDTKAVTDAFSIGVELWL